MIFIVIVAIQKNNWHPMIVPTHIRSSSFRKQIMAIKVFSILRFQMICITSVTSNCVSKLTLVLKIKRSAEGENRCVLFMKLLSFTLPLLKKEIDFEKKLSDY